MLQSAKNKIPSKIRAAQIFILLAFAEFLRITVITGYGRVTNDSASYLNMAFHYAKTGTFFYEPSREAGYQTAIWLFSLPAYWMSNAIASPYNPRFAVHMFMLTSLLYLISNILPGKKDD